MKNVSHQTPRKRTRRNSPRQNVSGFDEAPVALVLVNPDGTFIDANKKFCELTGYSVTELRRMNFAELTASANRKVNIEAFEAMVNDGQDTYRTEKRYKRKDGSLMLARLTATLVRRKNGKPDYFVSVIEPADKDDKTNGQLRRINRLYRILGRANDVIFLDEDRVHLLQRLCDLLIEEGDLCSVYVIRHNPTTDAYTPLVAAGAPLADLQQVRLASADGVLSKGPIVRAIKTGKPAISNNIPNDPTMKPWKTLALKQGCYSTVALPIAFGEKCQLVLVVGAKERDYFSYDEVDLLMMVARNLSFAFAGSEREKARRHSERESRESQARFRELAESIDDVFWLTDGGYRKILYVSPAFEKIWQRPAKSVLSNLQVWFDSIHPDDKIIALQNFSTPKINTHFQLEYRILRPDGSERFILHRTFPIRDQKGDIERVASVTRDISDHRHLQEKLHSVYRRLTEMLENLTDGYYELDQDFRFLYCNSQYLKMFGQNREHLLGSCLWDVFPGLYDSSHGAVIRRAMQTGNIEVFEDYYAPLYGWYEIRIYPSNDRISVFIRDNTETQQLAKSLLRERARLVHAQSVAKIGSWETDLQTFLVEWSEETYNIFGIDPVIFRPSHDSFLQFVHPEDKEMVDETFRTSFSENKTCTLIHRIITADGTEKYVEEYWQVYRDSEGKPARAVGTCQDITERQKAALENRLLVERLTATFESITDAFMFIDRNWNFSYLNREAELLLQTKRKALLGKNLWQSFPGAEEGDFGTFYKQAMQTGQSVSFESFYAPLNMWVNVRVFPSEQGIAVYFRDITDDNKTRSLLVESEARFRELAENIQEIFYVMDPRSGNVTYISPAYEKVWGRKCQDLLENPLSYMDAVHPEDRSVVESSITDLRAGRTADIEYRILRPDGSQRWIRDFSYPIFSGQGEVDHIIGVSHDITERHAAEERILEQASLLDKASDAILVRDLDHRIRYWNKSAEILYGWSAEDVIGKSAREILYKEPAAYDKAMAELLAIGEWVGDIEQITRDARRIIVEGRWTLVSDNRGIPRSVLAINSDVSERRLFDKQLLRTQRLESNGTLAGGIAHDLNNILTPIMLASEILQQSLNDSDSRELLETIEASTRRGANMVSQILAFARGTEGEKKHTNTADLVGDVEKIIRDTFPKNIQVKLLVEENLKDLEADSTQLHQVLLNICVNARDAMPNGGLLSIAARMRHVDEYFATMQAGAAPGEYVVIEIRDSGTGIPDAIVDKIFDPFFTTKEVGRGTGLGLSTSLKIIQNHNGFIQVESEQGKGTLFRIFLPVSSSGSSAQSAQLPETLPKGRGELVLVVDDEPSIRTITQHLLEEFGYRVTTAGDGAEAIARFSEQRHEIRVILTDMMMPTMDGQSLVTVIRKMKTDLPIILTSGVANEAALARLSELGVPDFLQKPYTSEQLLNLLRRLLQADS
ncbi:MAG: PAS domain S-box protein [Spirochaetota bacterium]